ncbi:hypothetical protein LAG90_05320 [Marinilongibacter aquaticus]|uniref:hypothetical protein n=1 Tax=Marinilongibacter aquaticus TaxID=2975157 RepID=UPI0021BDCDF5|nr:hypothetical protein [Marinilongibacter aquaticus]UBM60063.1 hypothetical protein LAG90_05320 [Marinilongibacter aquaticus]
MINITGEISYWRAAFSSYGNLYATWVKENFHRNRILSRIGPESQEPFWGFKKYAPEERLGFIHGFKNRGLYPKAPLNFLSQIEYYQLQTYGLSQSNWFQFNFFQDLLFEILVKRGKKFKLFWFLRLGLSVDKNQMC